MAQKAISIVPQIGKVLVYWYENKKNTYAPFVRKENVKVIRS